MATTRAMMTMHDTDTDGTLEILGRTRASLTAGPFSFHDWAQCTCGHLYAGATGSSATRRSDVRSPRADTAYAAAVVAVARVLCGDARRFGAADRAWYERRSPAALAVRWISDYTMRRAGRDGDRVRRAHAVAVIDEAVARLQAMERQPAQTDLADVHEHRLLG